MERKAQAVIQKSMKGTSSDANKRVIRSMIVKAVGEDTSRSISEDPFQGIDGVVTPPYPQLELCVLKENSTELRQCIDSMATNIDSFGYRLVGRIQDDENNDDMKAERSKIRAFLDNINFEDDITSLRMKTRRELEECGNAYWELVPYMNRVGIASIEKLQSHTMRLTIQDPESTVVDKYFYDEETNTIKSKKVKRKFRRYIQLVNEKKVYFKEWGDPRNISYKDGKVIPDEELSTRRGELANPVYHFKIESNRSPYGIPRYVGALFCVYGSRASEEINYITFQNNNIPSMIVTVSNGQLTDSSIARIQEFVDEKIKGDSNRSSFLILEAEPADETQLNPGTMKMDIKDLSGIQKEDQLFQAYDENNSEKIRRAWRIPPIFVGKSSDYNRATAQVSRKLADEQVFGPERQDFDRFMNRFLISEFGMKFSKFASNSASVTNDEDLVKILSGSEKTGGVTPNLARQILSEVLNKELPLYKRDEIEFDPDVPMSVTLVQMAKSVAGNDQTGTIAPVQGQFPQSNEVSEEVTKNVMAMLKKALYKDIYNEIVYEI